MIHAAAGSPLDAQELEAAFARVQENAGCPGVDGEKLDRFAERAAAQCADLAENLRAGQYQALPLRRIVVEKRRGSKERRTLLVPTVRDRVAQTAVARRLSRSFEEEFLESSYAYRPWLASA